MLTTRLRNIKTKRRTDKTADRQKDGETGTKKKVSNMKQKQFFKVKKRVERKLVGCKFRIKTFWIVDLIESACYNHYFEYY